MGKTTENKHVLRVILSPILVVLNQNGTRNLTES